jgi:hypothetical protein
LRFNVFLVFKADFVIVPTSPLVRNFSKELEQLDATKSNANKKSKGILFIETQN